MSKICALTTKDNPFDPFDQWLEWWLYDVGKGYNTCGFLAREVAISNQLTDEENESEIERAIDWIVENDLTGMYKKVFEKSA